LQAGTLFSPEIILAEQVEVFPGSRIDRQLLAKQGLMRVAKA